MTTSMKSNINYNIGFYDGYIKAINSACDILDTMFISNIAIMIDEWRHDDKRAVQGQNYFRNKMKKELIDMMKNKKLETIEEASKNWSKQYEPSKYQIAKASFEEGVEWAIQQTLELMSTCLFLDENWSMAAFRDRYEEYLKQ